MTRTGPHDQNQSENRRPVNDSLAPIAARTPLQRASPGRADGRMGAKAPRPMLFLGMIHDLLHSESLTR
jgi:hypothetical protein